jgi:hypothetical protein
LRATAEIVKAEVRAPSAGAPDEHGGYRMRGPKLGQGAERREGHPPPASALVTIDIGTVGDPAIARRVASRSWRHRNATAIDLEMPNGIPA